MIRRIIEFCFRGTCKAIRNEAAANATAEVILTIREALKSKDKVYLETVHLKGNNQIIKNNLFLGVPGEAIKNEPL